MGSMSECLDNKRLRIDYLIHMSNEAAPPTAPLCIDDLMDSACDCLDLCRERGVEIGTERKMIEKEKAFNERNSARLEKLIARVEAKLQKFDPASVGASSASPVSAAIERPIEPDTSLVAESQNRIQTHNAGNCQPNFSCDISSYEVNNMNFEIIHTLSGRRWM